MCVCFFNCLLAAASGAVIKHARRALRVNVGYGFLLSKSHILPHIRLLKRTKFIYGCEKNVTRCQVQCFSAHDILVSKRDGCTVTVIKCVSNRNIAVWRTT